MADVNTEMFDKLADSTLVNAIGSLYDLGEDNAPIVADHLTEMKDVQDRVQALLDATVTLYQAYNDVSAQLQAQKDANVKLMYDATQREVKTDNQEQAARDKANDELDQALADIDLTDEEED